MESDGLRVREGLLSDTHGNPPSLLCSYKEGVKGKRAFPTVSEGVSRKRRRRRTKLCGTTKILRPMPEGLIGCSPLGKIVTSYTRVEGNHDFLVVPP